MSHLWSHAVDDFGHGGILLECLETLLESSDSIWESPSLFLNLFGLTETFKDGVSVELIEEDHLQSVLRLFDKEEPNDFRYAIIEYFNNNFKVSIEPFPDFSNKQFFSIISLFSRFLHIT